MAIFLCRWPNGSFSVVGAANKAEPAMELDEIGDTDGAEISQMPSCMLDFEIVPPGTNHEIGFESLIRFSGFGEQTRTFVLEKAYPRLNETLGTALEGEETDPVATRKLWAEAVEIEMNRVHHEATMANGNRPPNSTPGGDVRCCGQPDRTQSWQTATGILEN